MFEINKLLRHLQGLVVLAPETLAAGAAMTGMLGKRAGEQYFPDEIKMMESMRTEDSKKVLKGRGLEAHLEYPTKKRKTVVRFADRKKEAQA